MLNSRVDVEMKGHPGYQCDSIEWAVDVCNRVGSDRLKILFDIYHVQIMQGDVIVRLKKYKDYIAHYHTAGNPGRNEIDDTQEIHYPGIMKSHRRDGLQRLRRAGIHSDLERPRRRAKARRTDLRCLSQPEFRFIAAIIRPRRVAQVAQRRD